MLTNIPYIVVVIIAVMIITLAIGVWRMEKRLDKKIEKVRGEVKNLKGEKQRGSK